MLYVKYSDELKNYAFTQGKYKGRSLQYVKSDYLRWALKQCENSNNRFVAEKIQWELNRRIGVPFDKVPTARVSVRTSSKIEAEKIQKAMLFGVANPRHLAREMKRLKERKELINDEADDYSPGVYDKDYDLVGD